MMLRERPMRLSSRRAPAARPLNPPPEVPVRLCGDRQAVMSWLHASPAKGTQSYHRLQMDFGCACYLPVDLLPVHQVRHRI